MRPRLTRHLACCIAAITALALSAGAQSTWYVDVNGSPPGSGTPGDPYTSLQFCFAQGSTQDGDTVIVAPGTYVEDLDLLSKSLDVRSSAGAATTILRPASSASVLVAVGVASGRLEGLTLRDGRGTSDGTRTRGGGVYCSTSRIGIFDCELRENHAGLGGGLCAQDGSQVTLQGCLVEGNRAWRGGGAHVEASLLEASDTRFLSNRDVPTGAGPSLSTRGIGVHADVGSSLTLLGCEISGHFSFSTSGNFEGAGLYFAGADALLDGCLVASNGGIGLGSSTGGGIYTGAGLRLAHCTVRENSAIQTGGGVRGPGELEDCDIEDNVSFDGGGLYAPATVDQCRLIGNRTGSVEGPCTGDGGGVHGGVLTGCLLQDNVSRKRGGGAYDSTLVECQLVGNRVESGGACLAEGGGGLWGGSATDCTFQGNAVLGYSFSMSDSGGGGAAESTLVRCVIDGNRVDVSNQSPSSFARRGGGTWNCQLTDCVVTDNSCNAWTGACAQGGGIFGGVATGCLLSGNRVESLNPAHSFAMGGGAAMADVTLCILAGNEADHGGAVWSSEVARCTLFGNTALVGGGGVSVHVAGGGGAQRNGSLTDSIAWNDVPDELEIASGVLVVAYSDVEGDAAGTGNFSDDPDFWNGAAGDFHLRAGSPCIDTGDPGAPLDPDGSRRDVGALVFDPDYVGGPYVYCDAKTTSDGCLPSVGWSGTPSISGPDDFIVAATQVRGLQNGILFHGAAPSAVPFLGGTRCVANPVVRTPIVNSGGSTAPCSGVLSFHFSHAYLLSQGLSPSQRVFAQFWFRDPGHPDGTNVGLSDAIDFTVLP